MEISLPSRHLLGVAAVAALGVMAAFPASADGMVALGSGWLAIFAALGRLFRRRAQAESDVESELRKFSRAVEQSPSTVMITDVHGNIEYVNRKFTELTGYTLDEVRGRNPRFLKSGHTPPEEYARLWRTISSGGEWRGELLNVKKNGELYWESALIAPIKNAEGQITNYIALKEDITARKEIEEAQRAEQAFAAALSRISAALNSTLDLDAVLDMILASFDDPVVPHTVATLALIEDGVVQVVRACPHFTEAHGPLLKPALVHAAPLLQRLVSQQQPVVVADTLADPDWQAAPGTEWVRSYLSAPIRSEGRVIGLFSFYSARPGFYAPLHASRAQAFADQAAIALRNAQLYDAVRVHADALEQQVAERTAALERERALLQAILDAMGEGVLYVEENTIVYGNRALADLLGLPLDSLLNTEIDALYSRVVRAGPGFAGLREAVNAALEHRGLWSGELALERADGSVVDVAVVTARVSDASGEPLGRVSVLRDISREKSLNEQRERFLRHAAHELRTPISNFKTRLYLLRRQPEKLFSHLDVMERVADEMTELVEDLLDIFRLQRGAASVRRERVDLCRLVRAALAACKPAAQHQQAELCADLLDGPVWICADESRLQQALSRLVANALYSAGEGGVVEVALSVEPDNGPAVIAVRDSGPGLSADELRHIFDPFYQIGQGMQGEGVSLGLTLARQIIELHQGTIQAESLVGGGMAFAVRLPIDTECPEHNLGLSPQGNNTD